MQVKWQNIEKKETAEEKRKEYGRGDVGLGFHRSFIEESRCGADGGTLTNHHVVRTSHLQVIIQHL
jgi:hypothetical protein